MRIIAGKKKGIKIFSPLGTITRPSSNRIRETIMGVLEGGRYGDPLNSKLILDLFSGTGSLGLEASSRGSAEKVIFVESNISATKVLKKNINNLGIDKQSIIVNTDATKISKWNLKPIGLIFSDPPYFSKLSNIVLNLLSQLKVFKKDAIAVLETSHKESNPNVKDFEVCETRKVGKTHLHFLKYNY